MPSVGTYCRSDRLLNCRIGGANRWEFELLEKSDVSTGKKQYGYKVTTLLHVHTAATPVGKVTTLLHVRTAPTPVGKGTPRIPHTPGRKLGALWFHNQV